MGSLERQGLAGPWHGPGGAVGRIGVVRQLRTGAGKAERGEDQACYGSQGLVE
ncbi:hypothetical protein L7E55_07665 [Pelotomaculum isophthalicicum JI]|uniref:Uncharacterized protein n=1 Tax=Pelotomaculum isophthalicicum JI TaxID=947010 RepID=A0A9X4H577_9FIRM|nr:hypothetical protein [Pelotomaculum isophthalicicum]MDF9408237.1 hypothetical protein [Pelotomaculum isophthalicicum JI]